jgi:excinuclease ABC subunit C
LKKEYRVNIFRLKHILEGNFQGVEREIEREMAVRAKSEDFEGAQILRDRLERFRGVLKNEQHTSAFLDNPNFYFDRQRKALDELRQILQTHGVEISKLRRIECFDISTFQGNFSVASQIVFIDGVPEKKWYRKYRIKIDGKPNDVAMMRETLSRRLKHPEWEMPDLVIVDGGKPQVGTIGKLFAENKVAIPLIGLAKRWEQIVIPAGQRFTQVNLLRRSTALQLLQQMRDEAHRFAITYHRLRRGKAMML